MNNFDLNTADISELLKRKLGETVYRGSEGVMVRESDNGTVMTDIDDMDKILSLTDNLDGVRLLTVKNRSLADEFIKKGYFTGGTFCSQWVYIKPECPDSPECDIRVMPENLVKDAARYYTHKHDSTPYMRERLKAGGLFGAFVDNTLAGFIGTHSEGSMGMLTVIPEYRRRGLAVCLEAYMLKYHISRGEIPFCHVVDGNDASIALQTKLGLIKAEKPIIWLHKD